VLAWFGVVTQPRELDYYLGYFGSNPLPNYSSQFVKLVLSVLFSMPPLLQLQLKDRLARHLAQQPEQLAQLVRQASRREAEDPEQLALLLHLFYELERNTSSPCQFLTALSLGELFALPSPRSSLYLRVALFRLSNAHIRKLLAASSPKDCPSSQQEQLLAHKAETQRIVEWVAATNAFLQAESEQLGQSKEREKEWVSYLEVLVEAVQIRDQVTHNFELLKRYAVFSSQLGTDFSQPSASPAPKDGQNAHISQFDLSELEKIGGINRLLAFELVDRFETLSQEDLSRSMCDLIFWLQTHYGISLTQTTLSLIEVQPEKKVLLDIPYARIR
jgi:hypothetical protein